MGRRLRRQFRVAYRAAAEADRWSEEKIELPVFRFTFVACGRNSQQTALDPLRREGGASFVLFENVTFTLCSISELTFSDCNCQIPSLFFKSPLRKLKIFLQRGKLLFSYRCFSIDVGLTDSEPANSSIHFYQLEAIQFVVIGDGLPQRGFIRPIRRPPSAVRRLPSAVRRLPSAVRRPPSSAHGPWIDIKTAKDPANGEDRGIEIADIPRPQTKFYEKLTVVRDVASCQLRRKGRPVPHDAQPLTVVRDTLSSQLRAKRGRVWLLNRS
ncbi:hypothetical protein EVAR_30657_1 [Eumeta japonica]|uniref:Uncharacterized protein n=1 Tax=Eumeta variegata TaxID=151549 RepID=A0A4C1VSP3_EUMVA|nr:hypothetical protein EVAR_30657_1 [Eumeta japonica]